MMYKGLLLLLFAIIASVLAGTPGTISEPASWTKIAPGATFNFSYNIRADYCKSSYAYSVYLVTEQPSSLAPADLFMSGYYYGRYDAENYPAVPYPTNPAPPNLTMPDFSRAQGGFGGGKTASNATFYMTVLEEWDTCEGTVGRMIGMASNPIIYNATSY
ncbi:uncharacterized protein LAESUDRAFT_719846 [Laetiporus sulphureus 93-53]|uniref:Uncharacterized protein n=1 Tax=Laetiporus sulphureus 93-53 TaxID=1314785 RepID=A0A165HLV8_9APHY|nr:uncharacterized protein LAESUDRAFT_719846 [Laetiporus sulphureus 93-53]KZT11903.1 hypothetical protein LAESUDRAFT_719846 [Laetiporus sulphureus 93-53]